LLTFIEVSQKYARKVWERRPGKQGMKIIEKGKKN
jgi:hypothetical protein